MSNRGLSPVFGYFAPDFFPVCKCGCSWAIRRTPNDRWRCDRGHFLSFPKEAKSGL